MITETHRLFKENLEAYSKLNQNDLMSESKMIRFAKDRGIAVSGVVTGDPGRFVELSWITNDSVNGFFHPFRIYPYLKGIKLCELKVAPTSSINRDSFRYFLSRVSEFLPSLELIETEVKLADEVSNLAILLEPIYWTKITNKTKLRFPYYSSLEEFEEKLSPYKNTILAYVKTLDAEIWKSNHEKLRIEAANFDNNPELYMLLRLAPWAKREKITGNIGGALWLRHIAEVIRLAFEEIHGFDWVEEHEAFGFYHEGAKSRLYGSERPIENGLITRSRLAFEFGLHTGSIVRWYVEGETEHHAALYALYDAALLGIEIINLKGIFNEKQKNMLRLVESFEQDKILRRFVFISCDKDVYNNLKFLKEQIRKENIVGYINVNEPDFEFENFSLDELIEISISLDEKFGFNSEGLKSGNKENINSGKAFENYYKKYSTSKKSLKGKEWGEALADYALDNPLKADTEKRRTFLKTIDEILRANRVRYDYQKENFVIDPNTFEIKGKDNSN